MAQLETGLHMVSSPRLDMDRFLMNNKEAGADSDHESETTDRLSTTVEQLQQQLEAEKERSAQYQLQLQEKEEMLQKSAVAGHWACAMNAQLRADFNELLAAKKELEAAAAAAAEDGRRRSPPSTPTTPRSSAGAPRRSWEQQEVLSGADPAEVVQLRKRLEDADEERRELMAANGQLEDDNRQLQFKVRELEAEVESLEEQRRAQEASSPDQSPQPLLGRGGDGWRLGAGGGTSKRRRPTRVRLCTPMDHDLEEDTEVAGGDVASSHLEEEDEEEEEDDPVTRLKKEVQELSQRCESLETDLRNEKAHHTTLEVQCEEFQQMWEKEKSCAAELQEEVERQRLLLDTRNSQSAARQLWDEEASSQLDPTARRVSTSPVGILDLSDRRTSRISQPRRSMISLHAETTEAIEEDEEESSDEDEEEEEPDPPAAAARGSGGGPGGGRAPRAAGAPALDDCDVEAEAEEEEGSDTLHGFLAEAGKLPEGFTVEQAAAFMSSMEGQAMRRRSPSTDSNGKDLWRSLLFKAGVGSLASLLGPPGGGGAPAASSSFASQSPSGGAGGWSGVFSAFADASAALPPRKRM